ncbi:MAG: FecR domain-containing protein [Mangrovibacterium sp.]|nr:FecR domain-containing protein [Mangrovibacterium sp.]
MNGTGQDKFWELAAGEIHHENTPEEKRELEELLKEPLRKHGFQQLYTIIAQLKQTRRLRGVSGETSWKKVNDHLKEKTIRLFMATARYAAVIIVAFLSGNLIRTAWNSGTGAAQFAEVSVPLGQMSEVTLYDGSHVWLNSGTTIRYPKDFGERNRTIILDGEAFFKVEHRKLPFRVKLKSGEIQVTGTSFNVVSYKEGNDTQITLVEGSVTISSPLGKEIAKIRPSQQIIIPDNLKGVRIRTVDAAFFYSWTEGKIVFTEERLSDVARRLERWYNVDIRFEGQDAGDLRFSGTILKNKPFDQIIKAFRLLLPVKVRYQQNLENKDLIIISKQNSPMKN